MVASEKTSVRAEWIFFSEKEAWHPKKEDWIEILNIQKLFLVQSFWRDLFVAQDCWIYMKFCVTFLNHVLTRWISNGHCIMRVHFISKVFDFYSSFSFHCQRCFVLHFKPSLLLQSSLWIVNFNLILYFKSRVRTFQKIFG